MRAAPPLLAATLAAAPSDAHALDTQVFVGVGVSVVLGTTDAARWSAGPDAEVLAALGSPVGPVAGAYARLRFSTEWSDAHPGRFALTVPEASTGPAFGISSLLTSSVGYLPYASGCARIGAGWSTDQPAVFTSIDVSKSIDANFGAGSPTHPHFQPKYTSGSLGATWIAGAHLSAWRLDAAVTHTVRDFVYDIPL